MSSTSLRRFGYVSVGLSIINKECMARLLIQTADAENRVISLKLGVNRVGRGADNDIQIEHPTLSARHCELHWIDEQVRVRDCQSTNGVFVNDQPIAEALLEPGQMLRLGSVELYVESVTAEISVPQLPATLPAPPMPLEDGAMPCAEHPQAPAQYRCTHCGTLCCPACVHSLKLSGRRNVLRLCPRCSGHVERIGEITPPKRKGVLAFLARTLRLPFRRKRTGGHSRSR